MELPLEDSAFVDNHILMPEERDGEGWSNFTDAIVSLAEARFDKTKLRNMAESMEAQTVAPIIHARPSEASTKENTPFWY